MKASETNKKRLVGFREGQKWVVHVGGSDSMKSGRQDPPQL